MVTLKTDNPECLQWDYKQVQVSVLGGIRIESLDRIRVTLKIEFKEQVIRHNLDLYNDAGIDRINPVIINAMHIRNSVILNWLKIYSKREVQYKAGHKHKSSTEKYAMQELDGLEDQLTKHHPFS